MFLVSYFSCVEFDLSLLCRLRTMNVIFSWGVLSSMRMLSIFHFFIQLVTKPQEKRVEPWHWHLRRLTTFKLFCKVCSIHRAVAANNTCFDIFGRDLTASLETNREQEFPLRSFLCLTLFVTKELPRMESEHFAGCPLIWFARGFVWPRRRDQAFDLTWNNSSKNFLFFPESNFTTFRDHQVILWP